MRYQVPMGDSLASKFVLALFSAAIAIFAKSLYERWQRRRTWDLLTAKPIYLGDGWGIQVQNGSDLPIRAAAAYLSIDNKDSDFDDNRTVEMANPGEIPLMVFPVKPRILCGLLDQLPILWQRGCDGFSKPRAIDRWEAQ